MADQDKSVRVYTGSEVDAGFIKEILEEQGIGAMIRNSMRESLVAGWVSGAQEDSCRVYVTLHDKEAAEKLINEYQASRK